MDRPRRIVFLTGTRADYGKIKLIAKNLADDPGFEVFIFTTGMHLLAKYGTTAKAVLREFQNVHLYNNQPVAVNDDHTRFNIRDIITEAVYRI
jgi:UDP-N-acetylglucosamine 2-epimerase (hydrolysing)